MNPTHAEVLLERVYALQLLHAKEVALDAIFGWVDRDLKTLHGSESTRLLWLVDMTKLDEDLIVGFLTATFPGRSFISSRPEFLRKAHAKLTVEIGSQEADALIAELT